MGVEGIPIPYGAPNASPHIERCIRMLREEALDHFILLCAVAAEAEWHRAAQACLRPRVGPPEPGRGAVRRAGAGIRSAMHLNRKWEET